MKQKKSQPIACTSTAKCTADCEPSTNVAIPRSRARAQTSATGDTEPVTFDMWTIAIIFVRPVIAASNFSSENEPSSSTSTQTSFAPCRSRIRCQGTMLEWCSAIVSTISSGSPRSPMFGIP